MFEQFTEHARRAVVLAQQEASTLRHSHIGTEHLLLGLLLEKEGVAARALERLEITAERVRAEVVRIIGSGAEPSRQIPFTPRAKRSLERALREALSLGDNRIGPGHILLSLVAESEGLANRILLGFGADLEQLRESVKGMLAGPDGGPDGGQEGGRNGATTGADAAGQASLPAVTGEPQGTQLQSVYDAVGGEPTFRRIAARFYALVAEDEILRPLYPDEDLGPAEERLRLFLIQQWGGPAGYTQLRGPAGLGTRHVRFRIARPHRDAWLRAMRVAIDEAGLAPPFREQLWNQLETMAWNFTTHASPRTSPAG